jgi:hypothetical protein
MLGFPGGDSIQWKLLASLNVANARRSKPKVGALGPRVEAPFELTPLGPAPMMTPGWRFNVQDQPPGGPSLVGRVLGHYRLAEANPGRRP